METTTTRTTTIMPSCKSSQMMLILQLIVITISYTSMVHSASHNGGLATINSLHDDKQQFEVKKPSQSHETVLLYVDPIKSDIKSKKAHVDVAPKKKSTKDPYLQRWKDFVKKYNKKYKNAQEEILRYKIFVDECKAIDDYNKDHGKVEDDDVWVINEFSDLTIDEFTKYYTGYTKSSESRKKRDDDEKKHEELIHVEIPDHLDYRDSGFLSPVKNQGRCGSCYAFAFVAALEYQYHKRNGEQVLFSEQELVDCTRFKGNRGCAGGRWIGAFAHVYENGGLMQSADYPYVGREQDCSYDRNLKVRLNLQYDYIEANEDTIKRALFERGPLFAAVHATNHMKRSSGGVIRDPTCRAENTGHQILIVGYGTSTILQTDYWIFRNSWGTGWANQGYGRIKRGVNKCGIADSVALLEIV